MPTTVATDADRDTRQVCDGHDQDLVLTRILGCMPKELLWKPGSRSLDEWLSGHHLIGCKVGTDFLQSNPP